MVKKSDSVTHHEDRRGKMKMEDRFQRDQEEEERARRERLEVDRQRAAKEAEIQHLTTQAGLVRPGDTRDMLLERIRKMREPPKVEEDKPGFRTPLQQEQFEAEQKAGREAVAKAEKEAEENRERIQKMEAEEAAKHGRMETVYHPNPTQKEVFPTNPKVR